MRQLAEIENPKHIKLLYHYMSTMRDEFHAETRVLAQEVKTGMMDPKRDAALVEIQNFIKKNIGKRLVHQMETTNCNLTEN